MLRRVTALGASSFLTQLSIVIITVVNNVLLVRYGAQSRYGAEIPLSAFVVIMKLFQIVLNIAIGIAAGAQPVAGYNYGAQKYGRVRELLACILRWTAVVCAVATVLFEAAPRLFIAMFGSSGNALYTDFAVRCLRIYLSCILLTCTQKVCAIFLQSIGNAKAAAPLSLLRDLFLIALSLVAPVFWGVTGIFWAAPIADVLAIAITAAVMVRVWRQLGQSPVSANRAEDAPASPVLTPSHPGVIVTVAREHGSSGKRIAQLVAGELGVKCYYKEMTALAAQESGLARSFISDLNLNAPTALRELYLSTAPVQQAIAAQAQISAGLRTRVPASSSAGRRTMCCGIMKTWCASSSTRRSPTACAASWRSMETARRRPRATSAAQTKRAPRIIETSPAQSGARPGTTNCASTAPLAWSRPRR